VKTSAPSRKNGRFSSKKVSLPERFTTAGSTSTWLKSGLTAPTSAMPELKPYLTSRPSAPNGREPSFHGLPGRAGATYSCRADA
jgi:hypothetical protein